MRKVLIVVVLSLMLGCARRWTPVSYVESHTLVAPVDPAGVRVAVLEALRSRRYRIESDEPGRIVAGWERRSVLFRVEVNYDAGEYHIRYLGSKGLRIREEESGEVFVDGKYGRWVHGLNRTIQRQIERVGEAPMAANEHAPPVAVEVPLMQPSDPQAVPSLSCCLEGEFYACPSEGAFDACTRLDPTQCSQVPENDGACS